MKILSSIVLIVLAVLCAGLNCNHRGIEPEEIPVKTSASIQVTFDVIDRAADSMDENIARFLNKTKRLDLAIYKRSKDTSIIRLIHPISDTLKQEK